MTTINPALVDAFKRAATLPSPGELAPAALAIARVAYPSLDPAPYLGRLDELGSQAATHIEGEDPDARIAGLNQFLFDECGFVGSRGPYHDPRDSFLNDVLERRTGIPIALGTVYIEVARRVDFIVYGVNFPGRFLLTVPTPSGHVILDPFDSGAILTPTDCQQRWRQYVAPTEPFDWAALAPASKPEILARMLRNLKRIYVELRSFQKARAISELLLALDPSAVSELRDRGLIAYQLRDFSAALRDLEAYLQLARASTTNDAKVEQAQVWEHVKALRRHVAGLN